MEKGTKTNCTESVIVQVCVKKLLYFKQSEVEFELSCYSTDSSKLYLLYLNLTSTSEGPNNYSSKSYHNYLTYDG